MPSIIEEIKKIKEELLKTGDSEFRFMYNGIKVGKDLFKGYFCYTQSTKGDFVITFYSREYRRMPTPIHEALAVQNDTDTMTDYFEKDRITFQRNTKFWKPALLAAIKDKAKHLQRLEKSGQTNDGLCRDIQNLLEEFKTL